eukprot:TRINITY_DN2958_c0_g1_i1.p1 TRINITY_DN2958_c0_g1~~TRINITY_DN2958_c0_g1_i1.p1  ORF type:complete len:184 (-),score=56.92 TRINITY_DN2958_c0_g1_i1:46-516(-)
MKTHKQGISASIPPVKDWLGDLDAKIKNKLNKTPPALGLSEQVKDAKSWKPLKFEKGFDFTKEFNKQFNAIESIHKNAASKLNGPPKRDADVPYAPVKDDSDKGKNDAEQDTESSKKQQDQPKPSTKAVENNRKDAGKKSKKKSEISVVNKKEKYD